MTTHRTNIRQHKIKSYENILSLACDTGAARTVSGTVRKGCAGFVFSTDRGTWKGCGLRGSGPARRGLEGQLFFLVLMPGAHGPLGPRWTPHSGGRRGAECSAGWGSRSPCRHRCWAGPTGCSSTGEPRPTAGHCSPCWPGTGRSSGRRRCAPGRGRCPRPLAAPGCSRCWTASWRWAAAPGLALRNGSLLLRQQTRPRW